MARVRFVAATVQYQLVNDDGNTLAPIDIRPAIVAAGAWPPDLDAVLAQVDAQINPPGGDDANP